MNKEHNFFRALKRIIRPEIEEIAAYIVFIVLVLSIAFYRTLESGATNLSTVNISAFFAKIVDFVSLYMEGNELWGRVFLFGFWFLVGGIVYVLLWTLATIIIDFKNDVKASTIFMHPESFSRANYLASTLARQIARVAILGIALSYSLFWLAVIVPSSVFVAQSALSGPISVSGYFNFAAVAGEVFITVHIATILYKLAFARHSSFEHNT